MDYYFKKFSARRPQDVQFDQARNFTIPNNAVYNNQNTQGDDKKVISPRKKVNVVSFSTGESSKNQLDPNGITPVCQKSQINSSQASEFKIPMTTSSSIIRNDDSKTPNSNNQSKNTDSSSLLNSNSSKKDRRFLYNPRSWQNDSEIETKIIIKPLNDSAKGPTITKTIRKSEPTFKTPMLPLTSEFDMFPTDEEPNNLIIPKLKSHKDSERVAPRVTFRDQPELKQENKKLLVKKSEKDLFTVVKKTQDAAQCQDKGSVQHSHDDFRYLIEGIGKDNLLNTRILSILTLANRCVDKNFRKFLKPNRCLSILSEKLDDAYLDFSLGLTTACLIYVISRERDPTQFNKSSIELMINLMKTPSSMTSLPNEELSEPSQSEEEKNNSKASSLFSSSAKFSFFNRKNNSGSNPIRLAKESERLRNRIKMTLELIKPKKSQEIQTENTSKVENLFSGAVSTISENPLSRLNFKHIDIDKPINARDLIIESLINIGLRKTSSQFKTMIREHEALDNIAEEIMLSVDYLKDLEFETKVIQTKSQTRVDECSINKLKKIFHYTRFLENMTYLEVENQAHLVRYQDGQLVSQLVRIIKICSSQLPKHPSPSKYLSKCLSLSSKERKENEKLPVVQIHEKMAKLYPMIQKPNEEQIIILDCLTRTYRLMVNLSQNEFVSHVFNSVSNVLEVTMDIVLHTPNRLPESHRFDLLVLTLCTLVNQCQHFPENKSRIVHMELQTVPFNEDEEELNTSKTKEIKSLLPWDDKSNLAMVFDEIVSLFLYRDELVKSHDFERDDGQAKEVDEKPDNDDEMESCENPNKLEEGKTIEEAGLKWRLVKQNSQSNGSSKSPDPSTFGQAANTSTKRKSFNNSDGPNKKKKSRLRRNSLKPKGNNSDDSDEEEAAESAEEDRSDEDDDNNSDENSEEDNEDIEGVDVEFVTETKEDKDRLKEQMSSAHQHMEDSVVAAYVALLLGCIIQTSSRYTEKIRKKLPDGKFRPMAIMLAKLCSFLSLTQNIDNVAHENISRVIKNLESLDQSPITKS